MLIPFMQLFYCFSLLLYQDNISQKAKAQPPPECFTAANPAPIPATRHASSAAVISTAGVQNLTLSYAKESKSLPRIIVNAVSESAQSE